MHYYELRISKRFSEFGKFRKELYGQFLFLMTTR